jgi:hypothetical protein
MRYKKADNIQVVIGASITVFILVALLSLSMTYNNRVIIHGCKQ